MNSSDKDGAENDAKASKILALEAFEKLKKMLKDRTIKTIIKENPLSPILAEDEPIKECDKEIVLKLMGNEKVWKNLVSDATDKLKKMIKETQSQSKICETKSLKQFIKENPLSPITKEEDVDKETVLKLMSNDKLWSNLVKNALEKLKKIVKETTGKPVETNDVPKEDAKLKESSQAKDEGVTPKLTKYDNTVLNVVNEVIVKDWQSMFLKVTPPSPVKTTPVSPVAAVAAANTPTNQSNVTPIKIPEKSDLPENDDLRPISSEMSLGFGEVYDCSAKDLTIVEGPDMYRNLLKTTIAYGIVCDHGKMALMSMHKRLAFWLPYTTVNDERTIKFSEAWNELYLMFVDLNKPLKPHSSISREHGSELRNDSTPDSTAFDSALSTTKRFLEDVQLHDQFTFQIPDGSFVTRYTFLAKWAKNSFMECCVNTDNIEWHPLDQLVAPNIKKPVLEQLWGHEVQMIASSFIHRRDVSNSTLEPYCNEFNGVDVHKFLLAVNENTTPRQMMALSKRFNRECIEMLQTTNMKDTDILKIYSDFVQHCYPSETMSQRAFLNYCYKIDFSCWDEYHLKCLYRSFMILSKDALRFEEFLLGVAALHCKDMWNSTRCQYIFRFYDQDNDKLLDKEDFKLMLRDIKEVGGTAADPKALEKELETVLKHFVFDANEKCTIDEFFKNFYRFTGAINILFRSAQDMIATMHTNIAYQMITHPSDVPFKDFLVGSCHRCRSKKYQLSYHAASLGVNLKIQNSKPAVNLENSEAKPFFEGRMQDSIIRHSIEVIHTEGSIANKVLAILRQLSNFIRLSQATQISLAKKVTQELTPEIIQQLCNEVVEIFASEPRVLKTCSPCYVMGDIHGNISDLLLYERQLWPFAPSAQGANILFLGDYVDRGDFSIEVVCYLFAMKLLAPSKFNILRGNHEIRSIQRNFTFHRECMNKYVKSGQFVFDVLNEVLDHLPIVGIIDESIYCAHGGIPHQTNCIQDLYNIPNPLPDPEQGSRVAWEILWNDPITDDEFREVCVFQNISSESGWADNIRRSTAYYFSEVATRNFLKANNLSHIIRAHEMEMMGHRINHNGCLITVFSSSRYCMARNRAASVFCEVRKVGGLLKILSLET